MSLGHCIFLLVFHLRKEFEFIILEIQVMIFDAFLLHENEFFQMFLKEIKKKQYSKK